MASTAGRILMLLKGDWNYTTQYYMLDKVNHNNFSWVCKKDCIDIEPSDENVEYWQKDGSVVSMATTEIVGVVKPDGETITIDEDGTLHGASQVPDGVTYIDFDSTTETGELIPINADLLDGHEAEYFATAEELEQLNLGYMEIAETALDTLPQDNNVSNFQTYIASVNPIAPASGGSYFMGSVGYTVIGMSYGDYQHGYQMFISGGVIANEKPVIKMRRLYNGVWGAVIDITNYLPLTGGTLTGVPYFGNKKKFISWHDNDLLMGVYDSEGDTANSTRLQVGNATGFNLANALILSRIVNGAETKYPVIHTGNMADHVLPISGGGTVSSNNDTPITLKSNTSKNVYQRFVNSDGTGWYFGFDEKGARIVGHGYLLHTGNMASYVLPLSGGTVANVGFSPIVIKRTNLNANQAGLQFYLGDSLLGSIAVKTDGTFCFYDASEKSYTVLHTGNKPTGTYTGNGDATARRIAIGGIGDVVVLTSVNGSAIVTVGGTTINSPSGGVSRLSSDEIKAFNGYLNLATTNSIVNGNGVEVTYRVL